MTVACEATLAVSPCLDAIRGCADQARRCASCFITSQLTIRTQRWTGGRLGIGSKVVSDLQLPKRYMISASSGTQNNAQGGGFTSDSIVVEDISPPYVSHGGGGFTREQLDPGSSLKKPNDDTEILYLIEGELAGTYTYIYLDSSDVTAWRLTLRRMELTP